MTRTGERRKKSRRETQSGEALARGGRAGTAAAHKALADLPQRDGLGYLQSVEDSEREEGVPAPLGVVWVKSEQAWNFALYSRHAYEVTLLLYAANDTVRPVRQIPLDPLRNKTGRIWHCFVPRSQAPRARYYAYRVTGPADRAQGHRYDPEKILLDPFARAICFPPGFSRAAACGAGPDDGKAPLGVLPRRSAEAALRVGPPPPRHGHDLVVYELHVKGFTARANSGVPQAKRGTFLGVIEKIPYLQELGVTAVELLPVHQFDPQEGNYWGYMPLSFFAPHQGYAVRDAVREFRQMVDALHAAGIEVWMDVVYNHTCEGGDDGPTYSLRGINNRSYYLLDMESGQLRDDSGCGNTTRCAHPIVRALVLRSLRYWAERMQVDGFRFDLASIFARDGSGNLNTDESPLISEISALAARCDLQLVAEAWDISTSLLGRSFPGLTWRQWNGQFRDNLRTFVRGDPGKVGALMTRLYGSSDLFPDGPGDAYRPYQSVNYVTAHDGFCMYDLVAYNQKHNEANGQGGADGAAENLSWNCGWEGDAGTPEPVLALRKQQVKNFFCLLMLANGTPMFCAGDEFLHTQGGNNNPYNQDNDTTWLDWAKLEHNRDVFRFVQRMIAFRKARRTIARTRYWREDVHWYGCDGPPDLTAESRSLAYCLKGESVGEGDLYVMINAHWEPRRFMIQEGVAGQWRRMVDTGRPSPDDFAEPGTEQQVQETFYHVGPRSVVVLIEAGGQTAVGTARRRLRRAEPDRRSTRRDPA
jgi:isoamylase